MNNSNNFTFYTLDCSIPTLSTMQNYSLPNYQQLSFPQCFWVDQNLFLQSNSTFITYELPPLFNREIPFIDSKGYFPYQTTEQSDIIQISSPSNQLHFRPLKEKYTQKPQHQIKKHNGGFSLFKDGQKNHSLSYSTFQNRCEDHEKKKLNNESQIDDKKLIQNLRYQRKNIQANIVNKIYTYLKTCLKMGQKSTINSTNNKEKAMVYYKVLEKLEKAKKQNIKRQFLKGLISMQQSLPGYNKIAKQLQKKGQSIQQFEYNIRVIIKNYLRVDAINSILTSKKMNPLLWKDHIRKLRELEEYLFSLEQKQNQE